MRSKEAIVKPFYQSGIKVGLETQAGHTEVVLSLDSGYSSPEYGWVKSGTCRAFLPEVCDRKAWRGRQQHPDARNTLDKKNIGVYRFRAHADTATVGARFHANWTKMAALWLTGKYRAQIRPLPRGRLVRRRPSARGGSRASERSRVSAVGLAAPSFHCLHHRPPCKQAPRVSLRQALAPDRHVVIPLTFDFFSNGVDRGVQCKVLGSSYFSQCFPLDVRTQQTVPSNRPPDCPLQIMRCTQV